MLRFAKPACPCCEQLAAGTIETIPGLAILCEAGGGCFDYEGTTDLDWNSQRTVARGNRRHRRLLLECSGGHRWWSRYEEFE